MCKMIGVWYDGKVRCWKMLYCLWRCRCRCRCRDCRCCCCCSFIHSFIYIIISYRQCLRLASEKRRWTFPMLCHWGRGNTPWVFIQILLFVLIDLTENFPNHPSIHPSFIYPIAHALDWVYKYILKVNLFNYKYIHTHNVAYMNKTHVINTLLKDHSIRSKY